MAIGKSFFENNRKEFMKAIGDDIAVVLYAGRPDRMSADNDYRFLPDRNFYYLTGVEDHDTALIMCSKEGRIELRLYVPEKDSLKERWHGKRKTHEEYSEISGIGLDDIRDLEQLEEDVFKVIQDKSVLIGYDGSSVKQVSKEFVAEALKNRTSEELTDVQKTLTTMRMVKKDCEIEAIRKAAKLTEEAVDELKKIVKPGKADYRLNADIVKRTLVLGVTSFLSQISLVAAMAAINNMIRKYGALDEIFGQEQYAQMS